MHSYCWLTAAATSFVFYFHAWPTALWPFFLGGQNFEWQQQQQQERSICFLLLGRQTRYRLNCNISYRSHCCRSPFQSNVFGAPKYPQSHEIPRIHFHPVHWLPVIFRPDCLYLRFVRTWHGCSLVRSFIRSTGMPACLTISFKMLQDTSSSCSSSSSSYSLELGGVRARPCKNPLRNPLPK